VLDDRRLVVDLIDLTLNHGVFDVRSATNLHEAEALLVGWRPDLAVLDIDHDDSTALIERLGAVDPATQRRTPALGITRRGDLKSELRAFDLGVDDIVTMPFSPDELLARAVVLASRATGSIVPVIPAIRIGEIELDIFGREVRAGNSVIHLSGIEQSLLYLLASRAGQVVTPDEILDAIWGTDLIAARNIVEFHIRTLRIKLQNDYRRPRFIQTVPGRGYRFIPTFTGDVWDSASASPATRPH
jgi:DNA-binding response OmpR family regulator